LLVGTVLAQDAPRVRVHFIDVGQGDATLIEAPCGTVLIDAGGENEQTTEHLLKTLDAVFAKREDKRLDLLLLTHPHIDHLRAIPEVLERYRPRNIIDNGQPGEAGDHGGATRDEVDAILKYADRPPANAGEVAIQRIHVRDLPRGPGMVSAVIDPLACSPVDPRFEVFWGEFGSTARGFDNANNHSVVVKLSYGETSALFTGDLQDAGIQELLGRADRSALDADIYQVGHHGSHNGTTRGLLYAVSPAYAVISMGPADRQGGFTAHAHGHPRREIVDMLESELSAQRNEPVDVPVATGQRTFTNTRIYKALYATGWDGDVVMELFADGTVRVCEKGVCAEPTGG